MHVSYDITLILTIYLNSYRDITTIKSGRDRERL